MILPGFAVTDEQWEGPFGSSARIGTVRRSAPVTGARDIFRPESAEAGLKNL